MEGWTADERAARLREEAEKGIIFVLLCYWVKSEAKSKRGIVFRGRV